MTRETALQQIASQKTWDVLVIGGGSTGLGTALEATSRGYSTLLLEQSDFAKSTSGKSTKLVHGGVRYLAQGNIKLVREANIERGLLLKNAPHLVKNQSFIIPIYSRWDKLKYTIGLKFYDWIAGWSSLGSSVFISAEEVMQKLPTVNTKKLIGGVLYHDGQFDDSRLAINLAQTIFDNGGFAINYMKVTGLIKNSSTINGVSAFDVESGNFFEIMAKAVVNATGVFVDDILQMDDPFFRKIISVSQGVHLVLDKKFLSSSYALMIPKTSDGRVLFIIPWHDKVLLGTTDTPVNKVSLEPVALDSEIDFILNTAASYLNQVPARKDVLSVFAGLRPLAAPAHEAGATKEISRSHKILVSSSKLFTILGGKWTTYRKMGEDMINKIENQLQWKHQPVITPGLSIHGFDKEVNYSEPFYFYGSDKKYINEIINNMANEWISQDLHIHKAQVIWAVKEEMARSVEDVLSRRTRALLLNAKEAVRIAPVVAFIMADVLGKDDKWITEQVNNFNIVAKNYILN